MKEILLSKNSVMRKELNGKDYRKSPFLEAILTDTLDTNLGRNYPQKTLINTF